MLVRMALRNVLRQKRRTMLTVLTMFGGFTLAAVSIGWSDGTYSFIIDTFTRNRSGHIQIHRRGYLTKPTLYDTIGRYEQIGAIIEGVDGVEGWAPRIYASALAFKGNKTAAVTIRGVDRERENAATKIARKIVAGRYFSTDGREAVLGKSLSEYLGLNVGDSVVVISQAADGSLANDIYPVAGLIDTGDPAANLVSLYLPLRAAGELLVLGSSVHEMAVVVRDIGQVGKVTDEVKNLLSAYDLEVCPWQEFARSFYRAMRADQQGMWISLVVIMIIVAVGVLNTVLMSVLERTREYGLLKALGTRGRDVFALVLTEVLILSLISIVIGSACALVVNNFLSHHGIALSEPFTYGGVEFRRLYTEVNVRSFVLPTLTVLLSSSLVALFPALRAARISPAEGMRRF